MVFEALQKVFRKPTYGIIALFISALVFAFAVWLPNIRLVADIVSSSDISFVSKIKLPISLLGSIGTNFTSFSATYTIIIAILFGIYVAMLTYFLKRRITEVRQSGVAVGFLGVASGVIGFGCAACGSFLLTSLTLIGAGSLLNFLPLAGNEFGIVGVILILLAISLTSKKIVDPQVCRIEN